MKKRDENSPKVFSSILTLRIIFIYVCLSAVWIFLTDSTMGKFFALTEHKIWIVIFKAWSYVMLTSVFLYFLISKAIYFINLAKEEAEKANKLKTEFLAQISHEIRTPVAISMGHTTIIKDQLGSLLTPEIIKSIDAIESADKRLIRTVEMILDMSEIQLGTYRANFAELDLMDEIFGEIKDGFKNQCKEKGIEFRIVNKSKDSRIYGDKKSIRLIIINLIENAIKFTEKGSVEVIIEKNEKEKINIIVSDTGIGIAQDFLTKIFEPFMQEDHGYSRRYEGNGLGLSLVKKYCELNKSEISAKSEKGKGSKFIVSFSK